MHGASAPVDGGRQETEKTKAPPTADPAETLAQEVKWRREGGAEDDLDSAMLSSAEHSAGMSGLQPRSGTGELGEANFHKFYSPHADHAELPTLMTWTPPPSRRPSLVRDRPSLVSSKGGDKAVPWPTGKRSRPTSYQDMMDSHRSWTSEASFIKQGLRGCCRGRVMWWEELEEPVREGCLANIVQSKAFEMVCVLVIVTNAGVSWSAINYSVETLEVTPTPFVERSEYIFIAFYTVELIMKLAVHRCFFFIGYEWQWNVFDATLVVLSILDHSLTFASRTAHSESGDFERLRVIRVLRASRILRGIRVMRFFYELRLMLNSLVGSFSWLMWSIVMLALIFYVFGLVFVEGVWHFLLEEGADPETWGEVYPSLKNDFGSIEVSVLSLFQASTGGRDWDIFYKTLIPLGWAYSFAFLFFIAFSHIALLNILTGIFVQRAMRYAQPDRDMRALELSQMHVSEIEELREVLMMIDNTGSGKVSMSHFARQISRGKLGAQLAVLGLDIKDAQIFFGLVAAGFEKDEIDIDDFIAGCISLRGQASSIDVSALKHDIKAIHKTQEEFRKESRSLQRNLMEFQQESIKATRALAEKIAQEGMRNESPCYTVTM